jgi:DNA-directed RNA polymerase subunit RPC12/RpoP
MNDCPKCGGLLIAERDLLLGDSIKCLNCGWRIGMMPKFKTDAERKAFGAKVSAGWALRNARKGLAPIPSASAGRGTGGIAGALEEIESKIAALEQVKRTLQQAQQLVNL